MSVLELIPLRQNKCYMKYAEVERKLRKAGCYFVLHGANYDWWYSPLI